MTTSLHNSSSSSSQASPSLSHHTIISLTPTKNDVLSGRGAYINFYPGNQHFRNMCFERKYQFDMAHHSKKRDIAAEIVTSVRNMDPPGRFLKRLPPTETDVAVGGNDGGDGPWVELNDDRAIMKACQVMRDYNRPDRENAGSGRKRQKKEDQVVLEKDSMIPHEHDVLSGRGAFVNLHPGNKRFRCLALERKKQFDAGTYADKRALAADVVRVIRSLDPPGRFLRREETSDKTGRWIELGDEKAVHKACQVMRDCRRLDRVNRDMRGVLVNGTQQINETIDEKFIPELVPVDATQEFLSPKDDNDKTVGDENDALIKF